MDSVKHLFRQISGVDYFLIVLLGTGVYFLAANMENRQRFQLTAFVVFLLFCIRLIIGVSFGNLIATLINKIHFIYIWAPLSMTIFITSMLYESGNLKTVVLRAIIASVCICASMYFVFG
ncbi:MAG TPA: hypothetical protein VKQ08_01930 [Cyclobacteriaceae bacterium]|nr:hypothetical protein [Cyclobacteriaceae bacterium]